MQGCFECSPKNIREVARKYKMFTLTKFEQLSEEQKCLAIRTEMMRHNKSLAEAA